MPLVADIWLEVVFLDISIRPKENNLLHQKKKKKKKNVTYILRCTGNNFGSVRSLMFIQETNQPLLDLTWCHLCKLTFR